MLQKWDYYMDKRWNKICERCRKGIPPSLRGVAWIHLCAAHKKKRNNPELFSILNQKPGNESINDEIVKDLHRQFPSHEMFAGTNTEGQQDLFIVLKNFSIFNQEVGYCQVSFFNSNFRQSRDLDSRPLSDLFWIIGQIIA